MGSRSKPISYYDRVHPAVLCTAMVCVLAGWLGLIAGVVACLHFNLDPEPLLKYLGPAAVLAALGPGLNQVGVIALKSQLGRIERNTGETPALPAPRTYSGNDASALYGSPR